MSKTTRVNVPVSEWQWYGNAGHFICGHRCRFHLCTRIGDYLVSTVGELFLDEADDRQFGEPLGAGPHCFETMVFRVEGECIAEGCDCGMPLHSGSALDTCRSLTRGESRRDHLALCQKWSAR